MFPIPDADTLRMCSLLNSGAFGLLFLFLWAGRRAERHLLYWAANSFLYGFVLVAFGLAGQNLIATTTLFALLALSNLLPLIGLRSFEGRPAFEPWMPLPLIAAAGFHLLPRLCGDGVPQGLLGGLDAIGLAIAMGINGAMMMAGPSRGQRIAGGSMLAYMPAFAVSFVAEINAAPGMSPLSMAPLVADQFLLGILNLGLLAIPFDHAQQQLREAALRDPLTRLWNRAGLDTHRRRLVRAGASLIAIDVDHFKLVNDMHGHQAGDALLAAIAVEADRLATAHGGVAARVGGDEFVMLLPAHCADPTGIAQRLAQRLRARSQPTERWGLSTGIATVTGPDDFVAALHRADQALYQAKANGRNRLAA